MLHVRDDRMPGIVRRMTVKERDKYLIELRLVHRREPNLFRLFELRRIGKRGGGETRLCRLGLFLLGGFLSTRKFTLLAYHCRLLLPFVVCWLFGVQTVVRLSESDS